MEIEIQKNEESYIKGIDAFRKLALSIPSLCVSLASACLAFEIYYIKHVYIANPGPSLNDIVIIVPIIVGSTLLVAAATSIDWFVDSLSPQEISALNAMHKERDGKDFKVFSEENNGFYMRLRLFSGGYFLFCISIGILLFTLNASVPLFLEKSLPDYLMRAGLIVFSLYYSSLLVIKMLTTNISITIWRILFWAGVAITPLYGFVMIMLLNGS